MRRVIATEYTPELTVQIKRAAAGEIGRDKLPQELAKLAQAQQSLLHANALMNRDQRLRITIDIQDILNGPVVELFKELAALATLAETLPQGEEYVVPIPYVSEDVTRPIAEWDAGCLWRSNQPYLDQRDRNILDAVRRANPPTSPIGAVDLDVAPPAAELAARVVDAQREVARLQAEIDRWESRRQTLMREADEIEASITTANDRAVLTAVAGE